MKKTGWIAVLVAGLVFSTSALALESANYKIKAGDKEVGKAKITLESQGDKESVTLEISYKLNDNSYSIKQTATYKNKRIQEFTSEFKEIKVEKGTVGQLIDIVSDVADDKKVKEATEKAQDMVSKQKEKVKKVKGKLEGENYLISSDDESSKIAASQIQAFSLDFFIGLRPKKQGKIAILDMVQGKLAQREIKREENADSWVYPEGWKRDKATYDPSERLPVKIKLKRGSKEKSVDLVFEKVSK